MIRHFLYDSKVADLGGFVHRVRVPKKDSVRVERLWAGWMLTK